MSDPYNDYLEWRDKVLNRLHDVIDAEREVCGRSGPWSDAECSAFFAMRCDLVNNTEAWLELLGEKP